MTTIKTVLYEVLEGRTRVAGIFNFIIMSLIVLNVIAVMFSSVEVIAKQYQIWLDRFELVSVMIFSIEYTLRLWLCTMNDKYTKPFLGRLSFAFTPMMLIDILSIIPFYLAMLTDDLLLLRIMRLFRLLRLAKLARYSNAMRALGGVVSKKRHELLVTSLIMFIFLIVSSSLMYYAEHEQQPEAFSSIPAAMWWGVATLTTVGYGDIYPVTGIGKFLAAIISIFGIGMFALPTGILGAGFVEEMEQRKQERRKRRRSKNKGNINKASTCPHCGKIIKPDLDS
ncbi:MAG: ion transporter [Mariprofundales bacterium]